MLRTLIAAAASAMLLSSPASAVTLVFSDNFSGYGPDTVLNAPNSVFGGNWTTTNGTVDYLAAGSDFDYLCPAGTNCVDLDGSTGDAGVFETAMTFGPGIYNVLFQFSGSNRIASPLDVLTISFGSIVRTIELAYKQFGSQASFGTDFLNIRVNAPTTLKFTDAGNDNQGMLLKTVNIEKVAPIPVPAAGGLLALGLGALAFMRRRKQAVV